MWGLEWKWVNVRASGTDNTTMSTRAVAVEAGLHKADTIVTLDGTGKKISSILVCRLFRDGAHASDTYAGAALLSECDFHFQADTLGSRIEWVK